ncbi:DNA-binding transcriptional regulator, AcrR family [Bosea sp. CRIB-10]|uniref:TetR/AcrR family transcriptional regulator n=1 Tax=Bosea sp. CRIB-10 TaxID=378404 RepID=UPI0008E7438A|nr:TetR/AcrR family transcriptional regulator [Bosea sp. CRIB-10]SFD44335.1 DNA-binding transcriptional regulator, AcrR family [Bosea sp. CRIB-10]
MDTKVSKRGGYHHGDLRQAMIDAAEAVLAEKGVGGFTLRECARRAGVSPAAPAHHFGNLVGLLTAIATLGFDDLSQEMETAVAKAQASGGDRLAAICEAYLAVALARPGRFRVAFGRLGLKNNDEELRRAAIRAFGILVRETKLALGHEIDSDVLTRLPSSYAGDLDLAEILFVWSVTHGFSTMLIDGQLAPLEMQPGGRGRLIALYSGRLMEMLLAAVRASASLTLANPASHG